MLCSLKPLRTAILLELRCFYKGGSQLLGWLKTWDFQGPFLPINNNRFQAAFHWESPPLEEMYQKFWVYGDKLPLKFW